MKSTAIAVLLLTLAAPALAAEHLEPEEPGFSPQQQWVRDYYTKVLTVLNDIFADDVKVRMINIPSRRPEYAVGIAATADAYRIVTLQPPAMLWSYEVLDEESRKGMPLPPDWYDVKVLRCDRPIEATLGERLIMVWNVMLSETHYAVRFRLGETPPVSTAGGLDGEVYHFSSTSVFPQMAGQIWSPEPGTAPGMLVAITDTMRDYCADPSTALLDQLNSQTSALEARLRATD